ncbi:NTF2-like protein [Babesia caballi]|uniref:NTF2-like protein n=1 Tax=Babesia caballi TaxID=5871 RepID=A0AAV4LZD4_BABCB|nr:NTF2-like protein [Babesia caballi]
MSTQKSSGGSDRGPNWPTRGYKPMENRLDGGSSLYMSGYPGPSGNTGWAEDGQLSFDNTDRFSARGYNRLMGGSSGYASNTYGNSGPSSNSAPGNSTSAAGSTTGSNAPHPPMMPGVLMSQLGGSHSLGSSPEMHPQMNVDEIAQQFVYKYYSLLSGNPAGVFNLYARNAQLSKPDLRGNRVVASGHSEIKSYYSQFSPNQTASNIKKIDVQAIGALASIVILIAGDLYIRIGGKTETRRLTQVVVICGDQTRSRFQIVNDMAAVDLPGAEKVERATPRVANVDAESTPQRMKVKPLTPLTPLTPPAELSHLVEDAKAVAKEANVKLPPERMTPEKEQHVKEPREKEHRAKEPREKETREKETHEKDARYKEARDKDVHEKQRDKEPRDREARNPERQERDSREKMKIVLFGLPQGMAAEELKESVTQRLKDLNMPGARATRVEFKRIHQGGDKGTLFVIIQVDSREAAELLIAEGITLRGKALTVEAYKRNHLSRDSPASQNSVRAPVKPSV